MDGVPQTTFMPRKPMSDTVSARPTGGGRMLALGSLLLGLAIIISIGLFGYENFYLQRTLTAEQTTLHSDVQQFDSGMISQMTTLSNQLATAKTVLNQHSALSVFFNFLAQNTITSVQFTNFSYTTNNNALSVSLKGQATGFAGLNAEENQLSQKGSILQNLSISNVAVTQTGAVTFSVLGTISPSSISYLNENTSTSTSSS